TFSDVDGGQTVTLSCTYQTPGMNASDINYAGSGTACTSLPSLITTGSPAYIKTGTATLSTSTGVLTWWPTRTQLGTYKFTLTADDGYGTNSTTSQSFYVTVRENYNSANLATLSTVLDAAYAWDTGVANKPNVPKAPVGGLNNNTDAWLGLIGGINGTLSSQMTTASPWGGTGALATPYKLSFDGTNDKMQFSSDPLSGATKFMVNTWVAPASINASSNGSVILTNGADTSTGTGFMFKQSDNVNGRVELQIGRKTYRDVILADAPVGYWRLGEAGGAANAVDQIGSNTLAYHNAPTLGAAQTLTGDSDSAIQFTAANQSVYKSPIGNYLTSNFSAEFWMKFAANPSSIQFLWYYGNTGWCQNAVYLQTNGQLRMQSCGVTTPFYNSTSTTAALSTGVWHHVVAIRDGTLSTQKIYIDGALASSVTTPLSAATLYYNAAYGLYWSNHDLFNVSFIGSMDEGAVYNYALSSGQIAAHHDAGLGKFYPNNILSWQPYGYWRLGEKSGLTAYDLSTNAINGTYTGGVTLGAAGNIANDNDTAVTFNGTTGYVDISSGGYVTNSFTVSAWFKTSTTNGGTYQMIYSAWDPAYGGGGTIHPIHLDPSGHLRVCNPNCAIGTHTYVDGSWHYVATVGDSTGTNAYVDGNTTPEVSVAVSSDAAYGLNRLGASADSTPLYYFNGLIDEVAVFRYPLSAQQISEIFTSSAFWKCLSKTIFTDNAWSMLSGLWDGANLSMYVNGQQECSITPGTTYGTPATSLTVGATSGGASWWSGALAALKVFGASGGTTVGAATNIQSDFNAEANRYRATTVPDIATNGLVLNLDAANSNGGLTHYTAGTGCTSNTTWSDLSANLLNGTLVNFSTCSGSRGWNGSGISTDPYRLDFNVGTQNVLTSLATAFNDFTVEVWFKSNSTIGGYERLIDKNYISGFWMGRSSTTAGSWGGGVEEGVPPYGVYVSLADGAWHQLVSVRSGTTHYIYGDGITQTTSNTVSNAALSTTSLAVGGSAAGLSAGSSIATVRVYNRALSQAEVQQNCFALASRFSGVTCH
ncbi:LamG-like jellyroll fold domain-containing protein, partial [Bdellovibrionota bacterium FG-1]